MIFCPIDLPPIPDKQKIIDAFEGDEAYAYWNLEVLLGNGENGIRDKSIPFGPAGTWSPFAKKYPQLVEWMETHLPYEYFCYVTIGRSAMDVWPHVDGCESSFESDVRLGHHTTMEKWLVDHHVANEPCGYRLIISGSRDKLYLCKDYDPSFKDKKILDQPKTYTYIPEDTDVYALGHQSQPHGVDVDEQEKQHRLTVFVMGKVNIDQHQALLTQSKNKYKKYTIDHVN